MTSLQFSAIAFIPVLLLATWTPQQTDAANILAFMPLPLSSHTRCFTSLYMELAYRGHNVTFYTVYPPAKKIPNLNVIQVPDVSIDFVRENKDNIRNLVGWKHMFFTWELGLTMCRNVLNEPVIKELFRSTDKYDLIIMESFFAHEALIALQHKFGAPIINMHPFRLDNWMSSVIGNPYPMSYLPDFRLPYSGEMSFFERLNNALMLLTQSVSGYMYYLPKQEELMRELIKYPGSESIPPMIDMLRNTTLTLLDSNAEVGFITPHLPNVIPVGGIHIKPSEVKNLPTDLEKWMNDSPNGFIYFSLGSLLKMDTLEPEVIRKLANAFSKLPLQVLWKWELNTELPGKPDNVRTSKWFPQLAVLAHPKCRLFITHGGFHSVLEAAYFGKPVVGTPIFVDQEGNLIVVEEKGFGERFSIQKITEEELIRLLKKVINDPSYKENAVRLSKILKDTPMTPLETAVYWVEYVLRHGGAPHLKSPSLKMPWYKFYLIDVSLFCVLVFITMCSLIYLASAWVIRTVRRKLPCGGKTVVSSRKKKH